MTTLPFDFDIFLRSGSRIHPDSAAFFHGAMLCSKCERTVVANNHVRMMSWACGRTSIGKMLLNNFSSSIQRPAICGVSDDVAHVSMTSGSPMNPPATPRCASVKPAGTSELGSIGSCDSLGMIGLLKSGSPAAVSGYHSGIGTPK